MVRQSVIDAVRQTMDTREIMERYGVVFKRDKACCPFHGEKSPSLHVWKRNNIYKCFGCGESGDAISFLQKHEKQTFQEAVETLAGIYNIPVEYDKALQEEMEKTKDARTALTECVDFAQKKFERFLHEVPADSDAWEYLLNRGIDTYIAKAWNLGYAPAVDKFITAELINRGRYQPGIDAGLIGSRDGRNYDIHRNRITIPIYNHNGILVGFASRALGTGHPKYLNPPTNALYNKEQTWFALDRAAKAIKLAGFAYVAEGYFDVISMHQAAMENSVAACGTAITDNQVRLLKRFTDHVVLALDGDKAGTSKSMTVMNIFLRFDFKVEIAVLPDEKDPDEFIRSIKVPANETALN